MANKFNPLDPLGVVKTVKTQVDTMARQAGLPSTPSIPGLEQKPNNERAVVERERFPSSPEPARSTGLRLFNRKRTKVEERSFSHDRGV